MKQDPNAIAALAHFIPGGWDAIQAAQQRRPLHRFIDLSKPSKPTATDSDRAKLAEHGAEGLRSLGLFGVLDRLNLPTQ